MSAAQKSAPDAATPHLAVAPTPFVRPPIHTAAIEAEARAGLRRAIVACAHAESVASDDADTASRAAAMLADAERGADERFAGLDDRITEHHANAIRDRSAAALPADLLSARRARAEASEHIAELIAVRDHLVARREKSAAALRDATEARRQAAATVLFLETGALFLEREAVRTKLEAMDLELVGRGNVFVAPMPAAGELVMSAVRNGLRERRTNVAPPVLAKIEADWRTHLAALYDDADAVP
jgi:hypothetical protein